MMTRFINESLRTPCIYVYTNANCKLPQLRMWSSKAKEGEKMMIKTLFSTSAFQNSFEAYR